MKLSYFSFAASILAGSVNAAKKNQVNKDTFKKQALKARLRNGNGNGNGQSGVSAVYTMDMGIDNQIQVYARDPDDGRLTLIQQQSTGGSGSLAFGDPSIVFVDSTDSIIVAGECVVATNPGDNTVSAMQIDPATGRLSSPVILPSGGILPLSVAHRDGLVYVLNAAGQGTIQAFALAQFGCILVPIGDPIETDQGGVTVQPQGVQPGSINGVPGQIGFTPDDRLMVLIKRDGGIFATGPGSINIYDINPDGSLESPPIKTLVDDGEEGFNIPFGFTFVGDEMLVPAIFAGRGGDNPAGGEIIVYSGDDWETRLQTVFVSQHSTCWIEYANGFAYTTNTIGNTMSSLSNEDGEWELDDQVAFVMPRPLDLVITADEEYMYVTTNGDGPVGTPSGVITSESRLYSLRIRGSGELELLQDDLPTTSFLVGIALYEG